MDLHTAVKFERQPAVRAVGKQTVEGAGRWIFWSSWIAQKIIQRRNASM